MSFTYPEIIRKDDTTTDTILPAIDNKWDKECATFEILTENIKYGKKKKPEQSPININTKTVQECSTLCNLSINYKPTKCRVDKYYGNLVRIVHDAGSFIKYGENNYELKYVFFHTPSNHLIDGKSAHMEINFYHGLMEELDIKRVEDERNIKIKTKHNHNHYHAHTDGNEASDIGAKKKGVVLSVLVDVSGSDNENETRATKPNICLSQFIHTDAFRDLKADDDAIIIDVSKKWTIENLLPEKRSFYTYNGSIAMPPCIEKYAWVIFDQPIKIIDEYLQLFRKIGNPKGNRHTHPLNGRLIFFNPNVRKEENPVEKEDKNKYVEKKLSPIRIVYDNRAGSEYRARADYVIAKYSGGEHTGWQQNEGKLVGITKDWDDTSKIGYSDIMVEDIKNTYPRNSDSIYGDLVFDYYIYNDLNYYEYFVDNFINTTGTNWDKEMKKFTLTDTDVTTINEFNNKVRTKKDTYNNFNSISDEISGLPNISIEIIDPLPTDIADIDGDIKTIFYLLMTWDKSRYDNITPLMQSIEKNPEGIKIKKEFMYRLISIFATKPETQYIVFKKKSEQLIQTIDGDTCQYWGSNSTHYEGNLLEFWKKPVSIPKDGVTFKDTDGKSSMTLELKEAAKDGLMTYEGNDGNNGTFKRHNRCRNPNNEEGAPWCYTTNPKVRWQYCAIPDNTTNHRNYIIIAVFFMLIILAVFIVKLMFKHEIFSKIVAAITGGSLMSKAVFTDQTGQGGPGGQSGPGGPGGQSGQGGQSGPGGPGRK